MNQDLLDKLYEGFKVDVKPGKGNFKYVKTKYIIDRLNKTFEGKWSTEILRTERWNDEVLVEVRVSLLDEAGNILSYHDGIGSAKYYQGLELGNVYKSAKSRAIKDAAKCWGVALFLEEDDTDVPSYSSTMTVSPPPNMSAPVQPQANVPQVSPNMGTNNLPPHMDYPAQPTGQIDNPGSVSVPPNPAGPNMSPNNQVPTFSQPDLGKQDPPPTNNQPLPPMSGVPNGEGGTPQMITDIQKVAIQTKLESTGMSLGDLFKAAFAAVGKECPNVPNDINEISYNDALVVASYR